MTKVILVTKKKGQSRTMESLALIKADEELAKVKFAEALIPQYMWELKGNYCLAATGCSDVISMHFVCKE